MAASSQVWTEIHWQRPLTVDGPLAAMRAWAAKETLIY